MKKYPVTGNAKTYKFLYPHVTFFTHRFYKEFVVKGFEKIPRDKAVILAPNHQNAFMDAIVLLVPAGWRWQLSYLVRASIFKSNLARKFFNNINMLPVYRKDVDGTASLEKNDDIFDNCVYLLSENKPLVLYPEATHNMKRGLIPLKKGITRIAFAAEEKQNFKLGIQIFPIGIYYSEPRNFNERILIQVADPISISDYSEIFKQNPAKAQLQIKFELEKRLRENMIDIRNAEFYEDIEFLRMMDANDKGLKNIEPEFRNSKIVISKLEEFIENRREDFIVMKSNLNSYKQKLEKSKLRDYIFSNKTQLASVFSLLLPLLLLFPVYLYGLIHHIIPVTLPLYIVRKKIKDPGFHSSIKVALGMFFIGVFHLIYFLICWSITDSFLISLVYFFSLLVSAEVALWCQTKWNKLAAILRFNKFKKTEDFNQLLIDRNKISSFLQSLNS